ncbi:MAG TPA: class I SAM-dependent methyltransferase [Puia sp.]|nr:class I SAM-dependent methyltransferase [Puia sp.]
MDLPDSSILTNIRVQGHTRLGDILFEKKYITTRSLENRLCTDDELLKLPEPPLDHPHYREWQIRKRSSRRLVRYLSASKKPLEILDIGCGNGWLAHKLAEIPGTKVTGLDINFTELQQAARVFNDDPNLTFIQGDIRSGVIDDQQFDCIVFADSIQYFPSIKKILYFTLTFLKPAGEIHIVDTRLYKPAEMEAAKRQTIGYYTSLGYPEMADFHFHHCSDDLRSFHHSLLYNPKAFFNRLLDGKDDFDWVRIKNQL